MTINKDRRLGKGLAALLGSPMDEVVEAHGGDQDGRDRLLHLHVYDIQENPFQPRRDFGDAEIASLAESLKTHEMLQPILVRPVEGGYQLISGERRLRAAVLAGFETVPARVREADDRLVAELAIVENLQRKDLNAIEKGMCFKRYMEEHHCHPEELAQRLKIDRSTIANLIRLLELPEAILDLVRRGEITAGHARALLPLGEEPLQRQFAARIRNEGWNVREAERRVQAKIRDEDDPGPALALPKTRRGRTPQMDALEDELRQAVGAPVALQSNQRGKGKITLHFANKVEFERLRALLCNISRPSDRMAG